MDVHSRPASISNIQATSFNSRTNLTKRSPGQSSDTRMWTHNSNGRNNHSPVDDEHLLNLIPELQPQEEYIEDDCLTRCRICPFVFTRKGNMERHIRDVHQKIKGHKCVRCAPVRYFSRKHSLRRHIRSQHMSEVCSEYEIHLSYCSHEKYWENNGKQIPIVDEKRPSNSVSQKQISSIHAKQFPSKKNYSTQLINASSERLRTFSKI